MTASPTLIRVKPAPGRRVRTPQGAVVGPEGIEVSATDPFWYRRLRHEDVVQVSAVTEPKKETGK